MVLSEVDKHAIEVLFKENGWSVRKIGQEFPNKGCNYSSVSYHIKKVQETGNSDRRPESGRPNSVSTPETLEHVRKFITPLPGDRARMWTNSTSRSIIFSIRQPVVVVFV